jgi:hypothetical protein
MELGQKQFEANTSAKSPKSEKELPEYKVKDLLEDKNGLLKIIEECESKLQQAIQEKRGMSKEEKNNFISALVIPRGALKDCENELGRNYHENYLTIDETNTINRMVTLNNQYSEALEEVQKLRLRFEEIINRLSSGDYSSFRKKENSGSE